MIIEEVLKAAIDGDPEANMVLGQAYHFGRHEKEVNLSAALRHYLKAAKAGLVIAQYAAGVLLEEQGNHSEAREWFQAAATQGMPEAMLAMGRCFEKGLGVPESQQEMFAWYLRAADAGNAEGQYRAGNCLRDGLGCKQDTVAAERLLRLAAEAGQAKAWYVLALMFLNKEIASSDANAEARHAMRQSAELGEPHAMEWCGEVWAFGLDCEPDLPLAINWLEEAIHASLPHAKYLMGILLMRGSGVAVNKLRAAELVKASAEQGDTGAQWMLALMYERGDGVPLDAVESRRWLQAAANGGHAKAIARLVDE